jgi:hypothetical protein
MKMAKRAVKSEKGWDEIGKMIGKKMEMECGGEDCCKRPWHKWIHMHHHHDGGGFFGRAIFAIGVLIALNGLGLLHGIDTWVVVMIGVGFALMRL